MYIFINFYDGIVNVSGGTGRAISGNGTIVYQSGYQIHKETVDGVEIAYLTQ